MKGNRLIGERLTAHFSPSQMHPRERDANTLEEPPRLSRRCAGLFIAVCSVALWGLIIFAMTHML
jgi:hypothetical protein